MCILWSFEHLEGASWGLCSLNGRAQQGEEQNGRPDFPCFSSLFLHPSIPLVSHLSSSAQEPGAQIWRPNICQVSLGCFKALQNCTLSIPRNSTCCQLRWSLCAQDHRSFSIFSLLNSGCQFAVKNKIITNPPCCKWFHNYAGSFQGSALVILPQNWFSQINERD